MTTPQHFSIGDFTLNVASGGGSAFMVEGFADENAIFNPPDAQGQANMRIGPDGIQYSTDRQVEPQPLVIRARVKQPVLYAARGIS